MQRKPKANSIVTTAYDGDARTITYKVRGHQPMVLFLNRVAQANRAQAEIHGWGQRIPDGAAVSQDTGPGTPDERRARMDAEKDRRMRALVDHYNSGSDQWSPARTAGVSGPRVDVTIVQGLARVHGTDEATMRTRAEAMAIKRQMTLPAYLEAVYNQPAATRLREVVAGIRASAAGVPDAEDMYDELMGAGDDAEPDEPDADDMADGEPDADGTPPDADAPNP